MLYDKSCPRMFSFDENYGFLNNEIRQKLMGGPTIIFHRHVEVCIIFPYIKFRISKI